MRPAELAAVALNTPLWDDDFDGEFESRGEHERGSSELVVMRPLRRSPDFCRPGASTHCIGGDAVTLGNSMKRRFFLDANPGPARRLVAGMVLGIAPLLAPIALAQQPDIVDPDTSRPQSPLRQTCAQSAKWVVNWGPGYSAWVIRGCETNREGTELGLVIEDTLSGRKGRIDLEAVGAGFLRGQFVTEMSRGGSGVWRGEVSLRVQRNGTAQGRWQMFGGLFASGDGPLTIGPP